MSAKRVLLKVTGELFLGPDNTLSTVKASNLVQQIKQLYKQYLFGIVVGGGNLFRGGRQSKELGITPSTGHIIGMTATTINGLLFKDLLEQAGLPAVHFCAIPSPEIGKQISQQGIQAAIDQEQTMVFSGGTGNPFFTTDTTAVLRALQIDAYQVWKGTLVDGVYSKDPRTHADAKRLENISFSQAINDRLGVMDLTAYALAEQHQQPIRVFDVFTPDALIRAAQEPDFGSIIT